MALGAAGAALLAGCGSSKPAYCTQVSKLEESVKALEKVEVSPSNVSTINADIQKVGTNAKELESAVKTEFAPQVNSMKSAIAALEKSVKEVVSSPSSSTLSHAASTIPSQVDALTRAASEIEEVTKKKCE